MQHHPFGLYLSGKKAAEEEAVLEAEPSAPQQAGAAFWEELLKAGYQDLQQAQMEVLGKGKRERRQVRATAAFYCARLPECLLQDTLCLSYFASSCANRGPLGCLLCLHA